MHVDRTLEWDGEPEPRRSETFLVPDWAIVGNTHAAVYISTLQCVRSTVYDCWNGRRLAQAHAHTHARTHAHT